MVLANLHSWWKVTFPAVCILGKHSSDFDRICLASQQFAPVAAVEVAAVEVAAVEVAAAVVAVVVGTITCRGGHKKCLVTGSCPCSYNPPD